MSLLSLQKYLTHGFPGTQTKAETLTELNA
ncbi:hypothetical protein AVDCRST_MAG81-2744 [uncultured Synechococcales cyanobacterium]|uniref:Uncharacterized protein n=1 Tax=uncultured Synechococcales cyanobacterium TaxID=1936017 RepID=A0A6J4VPR6_9CYAN|nr:hypothetical protein AVDCRST_MAG81-2744 [uncultured Synechococcales cyanobacterium]